MYSSLVFVAILLFAGPDKNELRQIANANLGQVDRIKLAWVETQTVLSGQWSGNRLVEEQRREVLCDPDFRQYVVSGSMRFSGESAMGPVFRVAADGSGSIWELVETANGMGMEPGRVGAIGPKASYSRKDISPMHGGFLFNPVSSAEFGSDGSILSLIDAGEIGGMETLGEDECVKLEMKHEGKVGMRYWLALGKGCVPVRAEMYNAQGEAASRADVVVEAFQSAGGEQTWMPISMTIQGSLRGAVVKKTIIVDRNSVVINPPVTASTFRIEFPPGANIADSTGSGVIQYHVNAAGEWVQIEVGQPIPHP